ncbi:MAG: alkaline phosphatase family protein [Cyanobacteria bacterium J06554_11]
MRSRKLGEVREAAAASVVVVFLDGLGLGADSEHNPLSTPGTMPFLERYIGRLLLAKASARGALYLRKPHLPKPYLPKPIDARLGVAGLPQSATGQTTLYTGQNASVFLGRHQSGFANGSLRKLIDQYGLLGRVLAAGGTATLANAYSPDYFYAIAHRKRRYSVCTLLNLSAGLPFRLQYEYERGEALFWDIAGEWAPANRCGRQPISAAVAGKRLARMSDRYSVTLFECYLTDYAGHAQNQTQAIAALQRIDTFLEHLIAELPPKVTLVVTSDHGNVEDLSTKRHTLNPVPLLTVGPEADAFASVEDLTDITPCILSVLGLQT